METFHHAVHSALERAEFFDLKEVAAATALLREGALRAQAKRHRTVAHCVSRTPEKITLGRLRVPAATHAPVS